jgi:hypothetical protein
MSAHRPKVVTHVACFGRTFDHFNSERKERHEWRGKVVMEPNQQTLQYIRMAVEREMTRVASIGEWPTYINVERSLLGRVPTLEPGSKAPGFDTGIACCLYIIPEHRQRLAATLHANYSERAVEQVRRETRGFMSLNSESCWWLAASAMCRGEDGVTVEQFLQQVEEARESLSDLDERHALSVLEFEAMRSGFEMSGGVAFATRNGGMQGAYLAGHDFAVELSQKDEIWFVGTFRPSLGLEDFAFSSQTDDQGRAKSGPVHGSKQFVKCASREELDQVLAIVKRHLAR